MVRYCAICRGCNDLYYCKFCRRSFHEQCGQLSRDEVANASEWMCTECSNLSDTERECKKKSRENIKSKLKHVQVWHSEILEERESFLMAKKSLLIPFCNEKRLDTLICGKNKKSVKSVKARSGSREADLNLYETPPYINAELRSYQLEGINCLTQWAQRGVGGILGDEMGLGKTIQTISYISVLKQRLNINGPHLIITPLAVLQNWANEITRFAPDLTFKRMHGSKTERDFLLTDRDVVAGNFDVYLTTYETVISEEAFFIDCWPWATVTVDEGHKLKSDTTHLHRVLMRLRCPIRLLLTGTPLQNDLHELWSLLNFILPDVFKESTSFDEAIKMKNDTLNNQFCRQARVLLENGMMIRRLKSEVETVLLPKIYRRVLVGMTDIQKQLYRTLLMRNQGSAVRLTYNDLMSIMTDLQKVVNHPKQLYTAREKRRLIEYQRVEKAISEGAEYCTLGDNLKRPEPGTPEYAVEQELRSLQGMTLIKSCGKLAMLDRLLMKLKDNGSRVLLFSQYTQTLNVLEEYMTYRFGPRNTSFLRLDGSTTRINREFDVRNFNAPGSPIFAYLISTKAGGVGINLATADAVILYEPCYNPQVELQAEDRSHRIGQKKQVVIYKFITKDSFEEKVQLTAEKKIMLDHMVIAREDAKPVSTTRSGRPRTSKAAAQGDQVSMTDLWNALRHGTNRIFKSTSSSSEDVLLEDADLDKFISRMMMGEDGSTVNKTEAADIAEQVKYNYDVMQPSGASANETNGGSLGIDGIHTIFDFAVIDEEKGEIVPGTEEANEGTKNNIIEDSPPPNSPSNKGRAVLENTSDPGHAVLVSDGSCTGEAADDINDTLMDEEAFGLPRKRIRALTKRYVPRISQQSKSNRKRLHDDECFICDDGGEILECSQCPKGYHLDCVGLTKVPKGRWVCPWHHCQNCQRSSTACGGMFLRCLSCPVSFCMDCFPNTEEMTQIQPTPETLSYFEKSGYPLAQSTVFFRCSACKEEEVEKRAKEEAERKAREDVMIEYQRREVERKRFYEHRKAEAAAALTRQRSAVKAYHANVSAAREQQMPRRVMFMVQMFKDANGRLGLNLKTHPATRQVFIESVQSHCLNLQPHDEIMGINGFKTKNMKDIVKLVATSPRAVNVHVVRTVVGAYAAKNSNQSDVIVESGAALGNASNDIKALPKGAPEAPRQQDRDLTTSVTISRTFAMSLQLHQSGSDIEVVWVPPGCDRVQVGDFILRFNGYKVFSRESLLSVMSLPIFVNNTEVSLDIHRRVTTPTAILARKEIRDRESYNKATIADPLAVRIAVLKKHLMQVEFGEGVCPKVTAVPSGCDVLSIGDSLCQINGFYVVKKEVVQDFIKFSNLKNDDMINVTIRRATPRDFSSVDRASKNEINYDVDMADVKKKDLPSDLSEAPMTAVIGKYIYDFDDDDDDVFATARLIEKSLSDVVEVNR